MISEIYKENISIFIFNENIYLARAIKDRLMASKYEVHFYTDENLLRQSVYLALPHIVIVPSGLHYEKLTLDIRKMSREIQIIVLAPEQDYESVLALKRKGFINDFIIDPLKFLDSVPYRVDLACERWMLMSQVEEGAAVAATALDKPPLFTSDAPQVDLSRDSVLFDIVSADSETDAMRIGLEAMNAATGVGFVYFSYDSLRDMLQLKNVSFGMKEEFDALGIIVSDVENIQDFLQRPMEYKIFKDFIFKVFSATEVHVSILQSTEDIFGIFVALSSLPSEKLQLLDQCVTTLSLKMDNIKKTRLIHNYLNLDTDFECYTSKYFYIKISDEISRARRLSQPVSLVVFDISSAERTACKYASAIVAKVLKRFTRSTDFVGKVGLSRFGVLLPHCSLESGVAKAQTLQIIIKAALEENSVLNVMVKAGVTAYPDQCSDAMSLLDAGERASVQAENFEVCIVENTEDIPSLDERVKDRIKGVSL